MGSLRDPVPFGANPALAVFTAGLLAGSAAGGLAGVSTAAEVGDSSREVMQADETRNDEHDQPVLTRNLSERVRSAIVPVGDPCGVDVAWRRSLRGLLNNLLATTFPSVRGGRLRHLFQAVQSNNGEVIANILSGPSELTASGNAGPRSARPRAVRPKIPGDAPSSGRDANESVTLYIGSENWPFPIPLVEKDGAWHFDPDAGRKEVMFRRIGENELTAIMTCHELVAAEKQFRGGKSEG